MGSNLYNFQTYTSHHSFAHPCARGVPRYFNGRICWGSNLYNFQTYISHHSFAHPCARGVPTSCGQKKGATSVAPKPPKEDGGVMQADLELTQSNFLTGYQIGAEASLT
jgi:hypothetical protein